MPEVKHSKHTIAYPKQKVDTSEMITQESFNDYLKMKSQIKKYTIE